MTLTWRAAFTVALTGCALVACSPATPWSPAAYPTRQPTGYTPPAGPHTITATITTGTGEYTARGYLDTTADGACALDVTFTDTDTDMGPEPVTGTVVKAFDAPAFLTMDGSLPADTRNPTTRVISSFLIVHPLGIGFSAATETQSWCFLTALPYFTSLDDTTSTRDAQVYAWDTAALDAYLIADGHTFITRVLDRLPVADGDRDLAARMLADSTVTEAQFATVASPLTVNRDGAATVLQYGLGSSIQVRINLTPTTAQAVEPVDVAPWDFDIGALTALPGAG